MKNGKSVWINAKFNQSMTRRLALQPSIDTNVRFVNINAAPFIFIVSVIKTKQN
jgi:hypothetical protein